MSGDVELLIVGAQHSLDGLVIAAGGRENGLAQLLQREVGDTGHAVGHGDIPLGAGGGLEHNGIGDNGGSKHTGHLGSRHEALLLIHGSHDGGGGANRLVADVNGGLGLNVGQAVVIHDLQNGGLIQTVDGLSLLIVVHQDDLLAAGAQQMMTAQRAHHFLVLIQNGIRTEAALQHLVAHIVDIVVQMEADHLSTP